MSNYDDSVQRGADALRQLVAPLHTSAEHVAKTVLDAVLPGCMEGLRAVLDLHQCRSYVTYFGLPVEFCSACECGGESCDWPCPTAQIAIDALTRMGAL